jgi:hypothetical protein
MSLFRLSDCRLRLKILFRNPPVILKIVPKAGYECTLKRQRIHAEYLLLLITVSGTGLSHSKVPLPVMSQPPTNHSSDKPFLYITLPRLNFFPTHLNIWSQLLYETKHTFFFPRILYSAFFLFAADFPMSHCSLSRLD